MNSESNIISTMIPVRTGINIGTVPTGLTGRRLTGPRILLVDIFRVAFVYVHGHPIRKCLRLFGNQELRGPYIL